MIKLRPKAERLAFHNGCISVLKLLLKTGVSRQNIEMHIRINEAMMQAVHDEK